MEDLKEQIADILDIDIEDLNLDKNFKDYDNWDSLAVLSLISLADTDYDKTLNRAKIDEFNTIKEYCDYLLS